MSAPVRITATCLFVLAFLAAPAASAQVPLAYQDRPLTLPSRVLRIDGGPADFGLHDSFSIGDLRGIRVGSVCDDCDAYSTVGVGVGYGILDDLEVGGLAVPLQLTPDGEFLDIEAYLRWRAINGPSFELGLQGTVQAPTRRRRGGIRDEGGVAFGVPMLFRSGIMRVDLGPELEVLFDGGVVNFDMPATFTFQVNERFFIGPRTGLFWFDFNDQGPAVPLGLVLGGSVSPELAMSGWVLNRGFLQFGRDDVARFDIWEIGFGINGFIGL